MRPCFAFSAASAAAPEAPATLSIYEEIGFWGVQAADFRTALAGVKSDVLNVEINSPGGDVFTGIAIYNMLRSSGKQIDVRIMGVAASAASLIAMAGDTITMPKNTFMMVHNPMTMVHGNSAELRDAAEWLDKIGASITSTYVDKTGMAEDEMIALLSKDSWLTADEALQMGFCTAVIEEVILTAKFDMSRATEMPDNVKLALSPAVEKVDEQVDSIEDEGQPLAESISAAAVAADLVGYADLWAVACTSLTDAELRIASAKQIRSLCAFAKLPETADAYIKGNTAVSDVRAELVLAMAQTDANTHVDTTHEIQKTQTTRTSANPKVTASKIWDSHNAQKRKP